MPNMDWALSKEAIVSPASDVSKQSSDNESGGAKDENGQDIVCVVCNDKSSGKHYGQFTCEGRNQL